MLKPLETIAPAQSSATYAVQPPSRVPALQRRFPDTIELARATQSPSPTAMPPPFSPPDRLEFATLSTIVEDWMRTVGPSTHTPPPKPVVEFPAIVELRIRTEPVPN